MMLHTCVALLLCLHAMQKEVAGLLHHSSSHSQTDLGNLANLSRCMHTVSSAFWDEIIGDCARDGSPCMVVHQSDGWGCDMMRTKNFTFPGCRTVVRCVTERAEWLIESLQLKTMSISGQCRQMLKIFPIRQMQGKTGWHIFSSSLDVPSVKAIRS